MKNFKLDRRTFLAGCAASLSATSLSGQVFLGNSSEFRAIKLKVQHLHNPIGVDSPSPVLSWQVAGKVGMQNAYRILVASTREGIKQADLWDSGRIQSRACSGIIYAGIPLESRQKCYWQVTLWDENNQESPASFIGSWEMGLLNPQDWIGSWLAAESSLERQSREISGTWVTAEGIATDGVLAFRLPITSIAGVASVILQCNGRVISVTLDGEPLELFPYVDSLPELKAPVAAISLPLSSGRHLLGITVESGDNVGIATQIRLPNNEYVKDGWKVKSNPPIGWDMPNFNDDKWSPAIHMATQPWFRMPSSPAQLLRRSFNLDIEPKIARLYVAALGGYDLWLNGQQANDDTLQSEPVVYAKHIPYRVYDVSSSLKRGPNVLATMVADGFYASYLLQTGRYSYAPPPRRILLQLEIEDNAGNKRIISSDDNWKSSTGALQASEIYYGEDWDRTADPSGWLNSSFDDASWENAHTTNAPTGKLISRLVQPIRITKEIKPKSLKKVSNSCFLVDFGQNFSGRVRLNIVGTRGDKIVVRHSEILDSKGKLDTKNLRTARAKDTYILRGDSSGEILEPRFTYQGFRYVEISGLKDLKQDEITGLLTHSDLPETTIFKIDQPVIQKLWLNTLWSQRSNFVGWPTDCPQRDERVAWTGDANVFWNTAAFNMDVALFTDAFMKSMRDSQGINGAFPVWAPNVHPSKFAPNEATPGWADAGVMLPYTSFQFYADRTIIDDNWDAMVRYVEGVLKDNPNGIWKYRRGLDLGDWLSLDAKDPGDETTPKDLIATAMIARSVGQLAQMAQWTGRTSEANRWINTRQFIENAFAKAFIRSDGSIGNGSQTGYILALHENLVPKTLRQQSADFLAQDIQRRGTLLSTGFLGTPFALDVLADTGYVSLAYDLLERTEYPSWGYMVIRGATTIWERWNGDTGNVSMNSFNHYALGAVCGFLYRKVAGLQPLEPGFAKVRIAPLFDDRFGQVSFEYQSIRGLITLDWSISKTGKLTFNIILPANTEAEVQIPATPSQYIAENGVDIEYQKGINQISRSTHSAILSIGPGSYRFTVL